MARSVKVLLSTLLIYLVILMLSYALQTSLIFYPGKLARDYEFKSGAQEVFLKTKDGIEINGLFLQGNRAEVILYFHGNAGDLSNWQYIAEDFSAAGYSFFIIDYRGYGKSGGQITEAGLYLDADAALDFLVQEKKFNATQIIIYGRSIGSGVAVDLASRNNAKGLILESPFSSLKKLASEKVPYLLPNFWLRYQFDSLIKMEKIKFPVLFIHGERDDLIPARHSKALFETFKGKKEIVLIPDGGHNDLSNFPEYHETLNRLDDLF